MPMSLSSVKGMKQPKSTAPGTLLDIDTNSHHSKTFLARLCEQAERYDEMVTYMKEVAKVRNALKTSYSDDGYQEG